MKLLLGFLLGVVSVLTLLVALCVSQTVRVHWTPDHRYIQVNRHVIKLVRS